MVHLIFLFAFTLSGPVWASEPRVVPEAVVARRNFRQVNLAGADLRGVFGARSVWVGAHLRGANFRAAKLFEANFTNADLRDADLRDADLSFAQLNGADLRGANLNGTFLFAAQMRGAIISARTKSPWDRAEAQARGMRWDDETP